jgi:serine/threonine protein kinase
MIPLNTIIHRRYKIISEIARGGMGIVYLAEDQELDGTVALKVSLWTDDQLRTAFHREAKLLANLRHSGLPRVIDHFAESGIQALVMDYIAGENLLDVLNNTVKQTGRGLHVSEVLGWVDQLLSILQYLHGHTPPIIHRDIKPVNIKLMPSGQVVLLDFGLAKGTGSSLPGASLAYAPIEQVNVEGTTPQSDLYSLGASIYHLVTGVEPPISTARLVALHGGKPDPLLPVNEINPMVSPGISHVILQAMSLDAALRPQTAEAMREALNKARSELHLDDASPLQTTEPKPLDSVPSALSQSKINSGIESNQTSPSGSVTTPAVSKSSDSSPLQSSTLDSSIPSATPPALPPTVPPFSRPSKTEPSMPLLTGAKSQQQYPTIPVVRFESKLPQLSPDTKPTNKRHSRTLISIVSVVALIIVIAGVVGWRVMKAPQKTDMNVPGTSKSNNLNEKPAPKSTLAISIFQIKEDGKEAVVSVHESFHQGDKIRLSIKSSQSGVLYLLSKDQAGRASIIYPDKRINQGQNDLTAGEEIRMPPEGSFNFDEAARAEMIYIISAPKNDDELIQSIKQTLGKGKSNINVPTVRDLFARLDQQAEALSAGEKNNNTSADPIAPTVINGQDVLVGILKLETVARN